MKKINIKLNEFFKNILELTRKPVMSILPGQLSFFLLLSLIPIFLIIGIISSTVSASTTNIANIIKTSMPADVGTLLVPLLSGKKIDYNIIVLMISSLLLVSKGTKSVIRVASIIYNTKDPYGIKNTLKSLLFSFMLIILISFLIIFPVLGTRILIILNNFNIIPGLSDNIINMYTILKWPISVLVIFINLKIIYIFSPNKKIPAASVNKGSMFTTIVWVFVTIGYSYYITHLTKYNIFYGGAANIIILMLWIYLMSYIFVLGMSINASYLKSQNQFTDSK